jgi:hypothetical protein
MQPASMNVLSKRNDENLHTDVRAFAEQRHAIR